MKILVTGADGFVGRHLCAYLRAQGDEVTEERGPPGPMPFLDVADERAVRASVQRAAPEGVIHLAGFSSVAASHTSAAEAVRVNTLGTANLLTAVRDLAPKAKVVVVGSGETYGALAKGARAGEDMPLVPTSPYSSSKVAAEVLALQFHRSYGLHVICARPFNHLGRGQHRAFVVPSFAAQLQAVKRGEAEPVIRVGNLEAIRDFSHVDDVVAAYRLLLERAPAGATFNICSGEPRSIRSLLDELIALAAVQVRVEVDQQRFRPADIPYLVGDPAKIERLGWKRAHTVRDALQEVLDEHA